MSPTRSLTSLQYLLFNNEDVIAISTAITSNLWDLKTTDSIWMLPEVTSLAVPSKIKCADIITEQKGLGADKMRGYTQALVLSEPAKLGLFAKATPEQERFIQPIVDEPTQNR